MLFDLYGHVTHLVPYIQAGKTLIHIVIINNNNKSFFREKSYYVLGLTILKRNRGACLKVNQLNGDNVGAITTIQPNIMVTIKWVL